MKKCPHCDKEYADKSQYCLECGTLLELVPDPPRNNLVEHLRYGVKIAKKRPSVFLPPILVTIAIILVSLGFLISLGINYAVIEDPSMFDPEVLPSSMAVSFLVTFLGVIYLGLIYEPFQQHVFYAAVNEDEIRLWRSFRYANSRIFSFLGAYLLGLVVAFPIMFFWASKLPYEVLMSYEDIPIELALRLSWPLLFFVPLGLVYEMAISIMVWENTGIFNALKLSLDFLRTSYTSIGGIFVIRIMLGLAATRIPFGGLVSWILSIVLYLVLIDVFQRSKDFSVEPETMI